MFGIAGLVFFGLQSLIAVMFNSLKK